MPDNASLLIQKLLDPSLYPGRPADIKLIETHISWVILAGEHAYKFKKPLNLGFLDFSTLALRQHFCEQELILNRRLAPEVYHEVVTITGSGAAPQINGDGPVLEYGVKMSRFPDGCGLDQVLARGELSREHIDQLADTLARFHADNEVAPADSNFGIPAAVMAAAQQNFDQMADIINDPADRQRLEAIQTWTSQQFRRLSPTIEARKAAGRVRNCHGDMHLGNMVLLQDRVVIFDCIEFNDNFRWMDSISEIAFVTMDLTMRGSPDLARRLLNRYLERGGDYQGLSLLNFYQVYLAMVRAKVSAIRSLQCDADTKQQSIDEYRRYIELAEHLIMPRRGRLFIAHGVSGSGKTTLTQPLLEAKGMIRLRSDVERKRLFGLDAEAASGSAVGSGIYSPDAGERTHQRLADLASCAINAGFDVIIDATFLKQTDRARFKALAQQLQRPFVILHFHAPVVLLKQWIEERSREGRDASEATVDVLEKQLKNEDVLEDNEADAVIRIDTQFDDARETLLRAIEAL